MASRPEVKTLVAAQLARITDPVRREALSSLVVDPRLQHRDYDLGHPGARYPTWLVARSMGAPIGLAFCEIDVHAGAQWGYVSVNHRSLGSHEQWFETLEAAFIAS